MLKKQSDLPASQYKPEPTEWRPKWAAEFCFMSLLVLVFPLLTGSVLLSSAVSNYAEGATFSHAATDLGMAIGSILVLLVVCVAYPLLTFISSGGKWAFWTGEILFGILLITWVALFFA